MEDQNNEAISMDEEVRQESLSLAMILRIPDDIIINILERLPSRSLFHLLSYPIKPGNCYSYLSRISYLTGFIIDDLPFSNYFIPTSSVLEVNERLQSFDFKSFSFLPRNFADEYKILGSSNGFLLFSRTTISYPKKTSYVITNPFTKQTVILPYTHEPAFPGSVERSVCFVCEQDYSRCLTRYSVMFLNSAIDGLKIKIFTSKDHPNSVESFIQGVSSRRRKAVGAINNIFYWFMLDSLSIVAIDANGIWIGETKKLCFLNDAIKHCWCIFEGCMYCALTQESSDILELWVSQTIPGTASDDDFDWRMRYRIQTSRSDPEFLVSNFIGFDPRDPHTIFFITCRPWSDVLKSYNFQTEELQIYHGYVPGCFGSFPCEWFPWPLPLQFNV